MRVTRALVLRRCRPDDTLSGGKCEGGGAGEVRGGMRTVRGREPARRQVL